MNLQEYKSLLQHPENITAEQTVALQSVIRQYPYLQSAYAIRLKGLYNENSYQYNHTLKFAAAYTTDRTVLFDFITSENFAKVDQAAILEELSISAPKVEISKATEIPTLEKSILNSIEIAETSTEIPTFEEEIEEELFQEINEQLTEQSVLDSIEQAETSRETSDFEHYQIPEQANFSSENSTTLDSIENSEFESTQNEISEEDEIPLEMIASTATDESAAEVTELQNTSNHEIAIDGHLAEAKKSKSEESLSKDISIEEELGTPLEFSSAEKHSFKEWLQLSKVQPIIREEIKEDKKELTETELEKIKKIELIDKFIEASPKIPPVKSDAKIPVIRDTPADTSAFMTETLARVYLEQKKYQKAIQAYQILILKYPEKSSFFADRISDIKNIQQNN